MLFCNNFKKFELLRQQYPVFTYNSYNYEYKNRDLVISFDFSIGKNIQFHPISKIPFKSFYHDFDFQKNVDILNNIVFHIGMIEAISYWKCTCSPQMLIKAGMLDTKSLRWWKKLYFHGLGEFFYCNQIQTDIENFIDIVCESNQQYRKKEYCFNNETIIPIGGGKDSVVTLELLKSTSLNNIPMIINPRGATLECVKVAGFKDNFIEINRLIDTTLLQLNDKGFLNGHTPFSAMLAFYSLLVAVLSKKQNIALSNESSANEPTVKDTMINHQYSKSIDFESDFREYVRAYINEDVNYHSFLRPLSELQIGFLFSQFPQYFSAFKSCNVGSKTDIWCGNCSKCLFTFIILSPFLKPEVLENIFGNNLFENNQLLPVLQELCGETEIKPFECVGTIAEVCIALCEASKQYTKMPSLLDYFIKNPLYQQYKNKNIQFMLTHLEKECFVNEIELNILYHTLDKYKKI